MDLCARFLRRVLGHDSSEEVAKAMTTEAPAFETPYFNPFDPDFRANPYPYYKRLYGRPPALVELFIPFALVARYADAAAIIHDHVHFSSKRPPTGVGFEPQNELFRDAA